MQELQGKERVDAEGEDCLEPSKKSCHAGSKIAEAEMKIDLTKNTIICGDNLKWLKDIPNESIDLCYIDPPFFSNATYEKVWGNGWEVASFGDRFAGGIEHYIDWMKPRIEQIYKKLKVTGSIFLHCDHHANHRLRYLLDSIFGENCFVNEIIWNYQRWTNLSAAFQRTHDNILFYRKNKHSFVFNNLKEDFSPQSKHKASRFSKIENGKLVQNYTNDNERKKSMRDVWDISILNSQSKERIGYRTQKPEELIKRIIECASHEGYIVLDCFAGGFTTAKVCVDLNRKFICGDVSPVACKVGAKRLNKINFHDYHIKNMPQTEEEFRSMDGHKFAEMICDLMGWKCNAKKSGDKGIDGWDGNGNPVQIKNQKNKTGEKDLRYFMGTLKETKNKIGIFVAWDFVRGNEGAFEYVQKVKDEVQIELRSVRDLVGDLLIANEKRQQIEKFYDEKIPEDWKKELKDVG